LPQDFGDALDEQTEERLKNPVAKVLTGTHRMFGVRPTKFSEFVQRHAAEFGGRPI
jgi:hypothetical protein